MNRENDEENTFLSEVLSDDSFNAVELQEIFRDGRRVMDDAKEISDQMAIRNRVNTTLAFKLKGALGITLGAMAGIWGMRSAWQAYQAGGNEQAAGAKTGRISKSAIANRSSFLPEPASLVMDRIPANNSYFLNTTNLDHDSILESLLSKKLMRDMRYLLPNQNYYTKYIDVIFQAAISKATENSQNCLLDKKLFRSELLKNFRYLSIFFEEGTMINSPGLCNLKRYSTSIYSILKQEFDNENMLYHVFKPYEAPKNLSKEVIDASKFIDVDGLCNELRGAVDCLIKEATCPKFSSAAKITLHYARRASSEIALLDLSNPLEKSIFNNILNRLNHLNEQFYRSIFTSTSPRKFTSNSIRNALNFGSLPSRSRGLYAQLLIVHATIAPDLIELRKNFACKSTDLSLFSNLLLDIKKEGMRHVGDFVPTSSIITSNATKQAKIHHHTTAMSSTTQQYKHPNTTQMASTTKGAEQKSTVHKKLRNSILFNASTTVFPVNPAKEAAIRADIIKAALAAVGLKVVAVGSGALSQIEKLEKLRKLVADVPTRNIPARPEQQPPESPERSPTTFPDQNMEDWNKPGPSSRSDFRFPRISDELNSRISYSKGKLMEYINTHHKNMDISRSEEYRNEYIKQSIDAYEALRREGYFVSEGLALEPETEQLNIRSAKMMVAEHLDFVNAAIERTKQLFDIILAESPQNQMQVKYITEYLVDYFKNTLNIEDDSIITEVLFRLNEVASRGSKYLHALARNRFKNIWFVSTRGNVEESARTGDFVTNLDSSSIHSLPMFLTMYAGEVDDTVTAMFPEAAHGVNPENAIPDFRYDSHHAGESLLHEITHASSDTQDYMYFDAARNGRAKNAKDMMKEFYKNLKNKAITKNLRYAISRYCEIYNKPIPEDLYAFFEENPRFKAYIIMNNAECYETFFRDISEVFPYNVDPWDILVHSRVSGENSLGQMDVLNRVGDGAGPIV